MHKPNGGCHELLETTSNVLDQEALQMLLVSAQEVNIGLCVKHAVREWVETVLIDKLMADVLLQYSLMKKTDRVKSSPLSIVRTSEAGLETLSYWFPHLQVRMIFVSNYMY